MGACPGPCGHCEGPWQRCSVAERRWQVNRFNSYTTCPGTVLLSFFNWRHKMYLLNNFVPPRTFTGNVVNKFNEKNETNSELIPTSVIRVSNC